jgi:hypothetical protein
MPVTPPGPGSPVEAAAIKARTESGATQAAIEAAPPATQGTLIIGCGTLVLALGGTLVR